MRALNRGFLFCSMLALCPASFGATLKDTDQLDAMDREEFFSRVSRANECLRIKDYGCAERMLAEARKFAQNSKDNQTLKAAAERVEVAKQLATSADARRKYDAQQDELDRRASESEERLRIARDEAAEGQLRAAQAAQNAAHNKEIENAAPPSVRASTPFDGLDSINRINQDTQRMIAQNARAKAEAQQRTQADENRRKDETRRQAADAQHLVEAEAQNREAQRKADAARAAAESRQREQAEQARQKQAQEKARQEAEKAAEERARQEYLTAMKNGIRLQAVQCLGGEGAYYATGTMPHLKGSFCIDVAYEASCPRMPPVNGIAKTFIGMGGCAGDVYKIEPKPNCPIEQVTIKVTSVRPGCN